MKKKRVVSATSKRGKGKRRCISNLFRDFLPFKSSQGRRLPIRARRRLLLSKSKRPKSEIVQPTSSRQSAGNEEDRISKLPDDILMVILSFMTTKEAAATCVLSRRWRYLCASLPRLDCSCDAFLREKLYYYSDRKLREDTLAKERFVFINLVDSVVKMHQGQTLEEFRIDCPLEETSSHVVDAWIEFAFSKRVQRLVLNLSPIYGVNGGPWNYSFPKVVSPVGLTSLTILYLEYVNVKQEVVEHIISKCPVLEQFSLFDSVFMGDFKLAGAALKLKHLSLFRCSGLKCIEICDTNIVSFKYVGWRNTILHLENLPRLVELYVGVIDSPISYVIDQISGLFSQLESLTFEFGERMSDYFDIVAYPKLTKLRHLIIKTEMDGDFGLLKMIPLINACPYLERFVLQLSWVDHVKMTEKVVETIECPHQHLKVVELAGYYGRVTDVEFAMYFIHNAVALERMRIIPKSSDWELPERNYKIVHKKEIMREEKARCRAKEQLQGNVPPTIDLVIH